MKENLMKFGIDSGEIMKARHVDGNDDGIEAPGPAGVKREVEI